MSTTISTVTQEGILAVNHYTTIYLHRNPRDQQLRHSKLHMNPRDQPLYHWNASRNPKGQPLHHSKLHRNPRGKPLHHSKLHKNPRYQPLYHCNASSHYTIVDYTGIPEVNNSITEPHRNSKGQLLAHMNPRDYPLNHINSHRKPRGHSNFQLMVYFAEWMEQNI